MFLSNALPLSPRKRLGTQKKRKREPMNNQLHFGIHAPQQHISYQRLLEIWLEADREPLIDHMWLFDHFMLLGDHPDGPCFEDCSLLAAFSAQTVLVRLGQLDT